jgi:CRISPR-associated protein Cas1
MELVINKRGSVLSVSNGLFQVSLNDELKEIPVNKIKSIIMNDSTSVTFSAVKLAAENEIDLLFMEKTGKNVGRLWSNKFGSISVIRKNQLKYTASKDVLEYMRKVIVKRTESYGRGFVYDGTLV